MKTIQFTLLMLFLGGMASAQDTAFVSTDKITALYFNEAVQIAGQIDPDLNLHQRAPELLTVKAKDRDPVFAQIRVSNGVQVIQIPVSYSLGRAGRSIAYKLRTGRGSRATKFLSRTQLISSQLLAGNKERVADRKKEGGVKAFANKLSLAGGTIWLRIDIRNRSNLPYAVDFLRFYIRDLKTVARTATQEQEILPSFTSLSKHIEIIKGDSKAASFAFPRFSLSEDQAVYVEIYERRGNRNIVLKIKNKDLEKAQFIQINPIKHGN